MLIRPIGTLSAVAVSAGLATNLAGMLPGETTCVVLASSDGLFAGSAQVQTSPDNVIYTNVGVALTGPGTLVQAIKMDNFIRLNCTARTAGTAQATIVGAAD